MSFRALAVILLCLFHAGCATPRDPRDPAIYRPAPAHYPPLR